MSSLMDAIASLAGPSAYLVVGVLAALETAAFVGLFVPGELAMVIGGYMAFDGRAELLPMIIFATVGAMMGNSIGYELGRRLGPSIQRSRLGRRVGEERWQRAQDYLKTRGGRAVFWGRFIGVLRALVPALAGASRMRYRRFLFWSALGAVIWAPTFVLIGYAAGRSYRRVEHYAGQAGLVLLALVVMVGAIAALGHWVSNHQERVREFANRQLARPLPSRLSRRFRAPLVFAIGRLRPGQVLGLALTLQLLALGIAGWVFGSLVQDVLTGRGVAGIDEPITRSILERRVEWLTTTMRSFSDLGAAIVLVIAVLGVGLLARRLTRSWLPLVILGLALLGSVALADMVRPLVGRTKPAMIGLVAGDGFGFPSGHATHAIAVYGALAYLAAGWLRAWSAKVAVWTAAVVLVALIGFSRVYLGVHWATDVLGGYALGAVWLAVVLVTISTVQGIWRRKVQHNRGTDEPAPATASRDVA
ncbi:MAG: bifunctional DedA family/phosphatase PAP2 family protein [Acidimicrobiales bacterium]